MPALSIGPLFFRSYGRGPVWVLCGGLLRQASGRYVSQTSEDMVGTRVELLEHLWRTVINTSLDGSAVENLIAESRKNPDAPFAEAGAAAARMLDAGVSQDDIRLLLRSAAYEAVFGTL